MDDIDILEKYSDKPEVRAMVQLIPFGIGSALDSGIIGKYEQLKKRRFVTLLDSLLYHNASLTSDIIENNEFIHLFIQTSRAVLNTHRNKKIELFGRLLSTSTNETELNLKVHIYEEYLHTLEQASDRELFVLVNFETIAEKYPKSEDQNEAQWVSRFWNEFVDSSVSILNISKDEFVSILMRASRLGLWDIFQGRYMDITPGEGKTTTYFKKIKTQIKMNLNDVDFSV